MADSSDQTDRWPQVILHADMDAFYAAVEQLDDPSLRGKPVIVGGRSRRGVVSTASYEARPFGVGSAMPMVEALRRCPDAIVVPPRFERYQQISAAVMEVFSSFSPEIEPLSLDEAFLDMTGAERLFGTPAQMGEQIRAAVLEVTEGLTVSVGASSTKYVAKVASDFRKPDGLTVVPPEAVLDFLWPLPVSRIWGVGKRTRERLSAAGFHTISDVAHADRAELRRRYGSLGDQIFSLAWGRDERRVHSDRGAKSIGAEMTLETDVRGAEQVIPHLRRAVQKIGRRMRKAGLRAGGIRVKLKTASFRLLTRQAPLRPATDSTKEMLTEATALLSEFDLSQPMRLVGAAAFALDEAHAPLQGELFCDATTSKDRRLDKALDALQEKFGEGVVQRGHVPDEVDERRSPKSPREMKIKG